MDRNYCAAQREAIGRKPRTAEPKWRCIKSIFSYSKFLEYERGIKCCRMLQFKKHCVLVFFVGSSRRLNNKALFIDWKLLGFFFCCVCTFHVLFKHFGWSFFFRCRIHFWYCNIFPKRNACLFFCIFFSAAPMWLTVFDCGEAKAKWAWAVSATLLSAYFERFFFSIFRSDQKCICSIINLFNYRQCCRI